MRRNGVGSETNQTVGEVGPAKRVPAAIDADEGVNVGDE
jgi:hypothetical protein